MMPDLSSVAREADPVVREALILYAERKDDAVKRAYRVGVKRDDPVVVRDLARRDRAIELLGRDRLEGDGE